MYSGKHRLLIFLLCSALLPVMLLALIQTPYLSELMLNFSLRMARFRTGVKIDAKSWAVRPFSFSAALQNISFVDPKIQLEADELEVKISPFALMIGKLHLRSIILRNPKLSGSYKFPALPDREKEELPKKSAKRHRDMPTEIGRQIQKIYVQARKRRIFFDYLSVSNLESTMDAVSIKHADFEIQNLNAGQMRLRWDFQMIRAPEYVAPIENFEGSVVLLRTNSSEFNLVVPRISVALREFGKHSLELNGKWPGDMSVKFDEQLSDTNLWLQNSPLLKSYAFAKLSGSAKTDLNLTLTGNSIRKINGVVNFNGLQLDHYFINNVEAKFFGGEGEWTVENLSVGLPFVHGDRPQWKHTVAASDIRIKGNQISGQLDLKEAGLCGILKASGVRDCYVSLRASGPIPIQGTLEPFLLKGDPKELLIEDGFVSTDPIGESISENELVALRTAQINGQVEVGPKKIDFVSTTLGWADGSQIAVTGDIQYIPTLLNLKAASTNAHLKDMFSHLLNFAIAGDGELKADISYNSLTPWAEGPTKVVGSVNLQDAGLEGQNFGTLVGPVDYKSNKLFMGPLKLARGGGHAQITGVLESHPAGSRMKISAELNRLELKAVLPSSNTTIFDGYVSGSALLEGATRPTAADYLSGPIDLSLETFKIFGVPFQKGNAKAQYRSRSLKINDLFAYQGSGSVRLGGTLNPDSGSELTFSSEDFPIRSLGIFPGLEVIKTGFAKIKGFWRAASGWGIHGDLSRLSVGGFDLPTGDLAMSGNEDGMSVKANFEKMLKIESLFKFKENEMLLDRLKFSTEGQALYGVFAYIKGWENPVPVRTEGEVNIDWSRQEGLVKVKNLKITAPMGLQEVPGPLIEIRGEKRLAWKQERLSENSFSFSGPTSMNFKGELGDSNVRVDGNFPLPLLDLIVPNFKFISGDVALQGSIPLPPDLDTVVINGNLSNASLLVKGLGKPFTGGQAKLEIVRKRLSIREGRGNFGSGEATIDGAYRIDFSTPGVALEVRLSRAQLVIMDDVPVEVTGDLVLKGEQAPYLLSGRLQLSNAIYGKEFSINEAGTLAILEPTLRFSLDTELAQQVEVRNSLARTLVNGRLFLGGTDINPQVDGRVQIVSGSIFANETEFRIIQGQAIFLGTEGVFPSLNLQAVTNAKYGNQVYKIELQTRGPVSNLHLAFTSDPALPTQDIVSLLAFGVLRGGGDSNLGAAGQDLIGAARIEALQALFGKAFGRSINKNTGFQVRFKAEADSTQRELIPKVTVIKKLSERTTATFGRSLDLQRPEKNFQVDYRLLRNVNLTGIYEVQQESAESERASLGVDVRFRFDVK